MNFQKELDKLLQLPITDQHDPQYENTSIAQAYTEMDAHMQKFYQSQRETALQVEELYNELLDREEESSPMLVAVIALLDSMEDFLHFTQTSHSTAYLEQAELMWNKAQKHAALSGVSVIQDTHTQPDSLYHHIISVLEDNSLADGLIVQTVKSGYIYNQKVVRKASIIVNKIKFAEEEKV